MDNVVYFDVELYENEIFFIVSYHIIYYHVKVQTKNSP